MSILLPLYIYPSAGAWDPLYAACVSPLPVSSFRTPLSRPPLTPPSHQREVPPRHRLHRSSQPMLGPLPGLAPRPSLPDRNPQAQEPRQHPHAGLRRDQLHGEGARRRARRNQHLGRLARAVQQHEAQDGRRLPRRDTQHLLGRAVPLPRDGGQGGAERDAVSGSVRGYVGCEFSCCEFASRYGTRMHACMHAVHELEA